MRYSATKLPGCLIVTPKPFEDHRGKFVKTLLVNELYDRGIDFKVWEEFYTTSKKDVLRGLHFQIPPFEHYKLVYCLKGKIQDVVVDIRKGSPTFKQHITMELSDENLSILLIPPGMAHGFLSLSDESTLVYKVTSSYSAEHDTGILWNSADIKWSCGSPTLSQRDLGFLPLDQFNTPFTYTEGNAR
jgi:dTDP-4-dehydrorhamnose 3,5-epimerase